MARDIVLDENVVAWRKGHVQEYAGIKMSARVLDSWVDLTARVSPSHERENGRPVDVLISVERP